MLNNVWLQVALNKTAQREIARCAGDFSYFATHYLKSNHPLRGRKPMPFHPFHERLIDHYQSNRFSLVTKFRGSGYTTYTTAFMLWQCLFNLDQRIMILSKTDKESGELAGMMMRMIKDLPDWMKPTMTKMTGHAKHFAESNSTINFCEPQAACGKTVNWLIIDEAAFIPNMDNHWKAMWPTLSTGGSCIIVSTVCKKYEDEKKTKKNWFFDVYERAFDGRNKFSLFSSHYKEHPDYADLKRCQELEVQLGKEGWKQEFEMEFLD